MEESWAMCWGKAPEGEKAMKASHAKNDEKNRILQKFWNAHADTVSYLNLSPIYAALVEEVIRLAQMTRGSRCLDLGCGTGNIAVAAAKRGVCLTAVDSSEEMVRKARDNLAAACTQDEQNHVTLIPKRASEFVREQPMESYDAVTANLVLAYVADYRAIVHEVHRILKPGGRWVMSNPVPKARFFWIYLKSWPAVIRHLRKSAKAWPYSRRIEEFGRRGWFHFFSEAQSRDMLVDAGFRPELITIKRSLAGQAFVTTALKESK